MTEHTNAVGPEPGAIDLVALGSRVWSHRWVGLLIVAACIAAAVGYLHVAPHRYLATMIVTPADQSGTKSAGSLTGLGSLVGLNLNEQAGTAFSMYGVAVTSYAVAELLSSDSDLMKQVFEKSWDIRENRWREPPSAIRPLIVTIKSALGIPVQPWHRPNAADLKVYLDKQLIVVEDKRKAETTLFYENESPDFARTLLNKVNTAADGYMRKLALARATTYVEYLEHRLAEVQVAEYRQSMAQVLGNYEKTRMLASSKASYAADLFGDIWVSQEPTDPKPVPIIILGIFTGLINWLIYVFAVIPLYSALRRRDD